MFNKPRDYKESELPLTLLGQEKDTYKSVFRLTSLLNSSLSIALKCNGYIQQNTILQSGEIINNAWVK